MRSMRVLVVGGGIGGLSAALALRFAGAKVGVYEQAAELGVKYPRFCSYSVAPRLSVNTAA
jgi:phytoene dehydrogenase-like protein